MNKVGRPRIELTEEKYEQLKAMVRIQCTARECCSVLGMDDNTLDLRLKERGYDNFRDFFKKHGDEGKTSLRREQWKAAMSGNATMLIWLGKQMLDQTDKREIKTISEWESMTDEQLDSYLEGRIAASFTSGENPPRRDH